MSLELRAPDVSAINALWKTWEATRDAELEATFPFMDYTTFLNVFKRLRALGLREEPQPAKLNIMVNGGLRFTLVGDSAISAYCRDNTLKGKHFEVMLKERKAVVGGGAAEVDLEEYGVRIKLRNELVLPKDDPRVLEALAKWASLPKAFRHIKRFSFTSSVHTGLQFDASIVRENRKDARGQYMRTTTFLEAAIPKQPMRYEMEVEAKAGATQKSMLLGITNVLRGIQNSYMLVRKSVKRTILELLAAQTGSKTGAFPGSQPVTLRKSHFGPDAEPETPNLRIGDYNVTDKADGLRCLLIVARTGHLYMVDRNLNVYATDRRMDEVGTREWAGAVLDGEWVTHDAKDAPMSRYYAFDIYNGKRGEDVSARPFLVRSSVAVSRFSAMSETVAALSAATYTTPSIPKQNSLSIHMKTFQTPEDPTTPLGIFREAASVLDRLAKDAPYHTDGLIFTPNASPLVKNVNTWSAQFKWKPASMNSVDFLVLVDKERGLDGKPTATDAVATALREDTQEIVRYKKLRLYVGASTHPAFVKPRDTILQKLPMPNTVDRESGEYRPLEFAPNPPDPMAAVAYVAINAGATDAAGAAPAASAAAAVKDDIIYCESGEPIESRTIVEMVYKPDNPPGWRWVPLRVRWDKTEQLNRGVVGGTLNSARVANDVWLSIHDPVTEYMIRTGSMSETAEDAVAAPAEEAPVSRTLYYQKKASKRDQHKIRGLVQFHNAIKSNVLLGRTLSPGAALLDMAVGQAGDIHKWMAARAGWVLGCDIALSGLTDPNNGAYSRYLDQMIRTKGAAPRMLFVHADSSRRYSDGAAGMEEEDRKMLRTLWGSAETDMPPHVRDLKGAAAQGFDVVSLMFAIHYFFKDRATLDGLLLNISETLKVGGYFVGCCFDGDRVSKYLQDVSLGDAKRGTEDAVDIWTLTKRYDDTEFPGVLPATDEGLGRGIDVNFLSIGERFTEFLVSWPYLVQRLGEIGVEVLNSDELSEMGLTQSTMLFSDYADMCAANGLTYPMSPVVRAFSFLNRWFIFRRRSTGYMAAAPVAVAAPPPPMPVAAPAASAAAPAVVEVAEAAEAVEAVAEADEEAEAAEAPAPAPLEEAALVRATGPIFQFYHKSAAKDDLKLKEKHWRRYLSPYARFEFKDPNNPAIVYPTFEAAIAAAKYKHASNKPELGAQLFSETGNLHQRILAKEQSLTGGGAAARALTEEEVFESMDAEGKLLREAQKPAEMRKAGATFDQAAWDDVKERIMTEYVRQRYEGDAMFRKILDAVAALKGRLAYYTVGTTTEMSGTVKDDAIEGENLYGRALMYQVGLAY